MRKILLTLAIALSCGFAFAGSSPEEEVKPIQLRAHYDVLDILKKKSFPIEIWTIQVTAVEPESRTYEIGEMTKETFTEISNPRTETHRLWSHEVRFANKETYLKENFIKDPTKLSPGQHSFGFVEKRRVSDDVVVDSWPIFYTIGAKDGLKAIISHTFEPGNVQRMTVLECDGPYFFPLRENEYVFKGEKLTDHTLYVRQD